MGQMDTNYWAAADALLMQARDEHEAEAEARGWDELAQLNAQDVKWSDARWRAYERDEELQAAALCGLASAEDHLHWSVLPNQKGGAA